MKEIIEKFNESWDNRGDIGLTKAEFHAYIQMSYYKGWKDAMEKMQTVKELEDKVNPL